MAIHVILEFKTREEAVEALGSVETRNIVEWFDDRELKAGPEEEMAWVLEEGQLQQRTA